MKLSEELITTLQENPSFKIYTEYVMEKINQIDSTAGLDQLDNQSAGEEAKIRHKTVFTLMAILDPIMNFKKSKGINEQDIKDREKQFGL